MANLDLYFVKSFTQDPELGNPVAVCLIQEDLREDIYFKITRQTGFSECVFIRTTETNPMLRFFSPKQEMNMCGHATLAAAHLLQNKNYTTSYQTKAGAVNIEYQEDGLISMTLTSPPTHYSDFVSTKRIAELLNINTNTIKSSPVKISVGTPKILVELDSIESLLKLKPNFTAIAAEIPQGIYPFVKNTPSKYYARQFNPATGINEDPVTGVAAGALGIHLKNQNIFQFSVEQGHVLNKVGTIFVDVANGVKIGGHAVVYDKISVKI